MFTKETFTNGMKVQFNANYADNNDVYTLVNYDQEAGTGRVEDENGAGWFVYAEMLIPVE